MTEQSISEFFTTFVGILYEAMPFIILGAVIAGLLEELVPQRLVVKILPRSRFVAILVGGLLGLPFPMCECGIIAVMRRLLRKGVPLSACVCYMLAGPIINVVVMGSTWVAFSGADAANNFNEPDKLQLGSWGMMTMRMVLGYLVAVGTSVIVEWQYRKHGNKLLAPLAIPGILKNGDDDEDDMAPRKSIFQRLSNISETALHDFVDITIFLILGAAIAAGTRLVFPIREMEQMAIDNWPLVILMMMGFAILLCLCSEADAFVAASFAKFPPSAKIGFLVLGPMLDFKLYAMYTRVFRPRLIWTIILSVVIQVYLYSVLVHLLMRQFPALFFGSGTAAS